ncbi:MAG: hypothetical protein LQ342_002655 [Letrouitia transgressa]|nr:MAG: hypothetical protein LQ342_002655 [Letrouitia transgressa]
MLTQRITHQSARRIFAPKPSSLILTKNTTPAITTSLSHRPQLRSAASQAIPNSEAHQILANQRLNRPVAPHLSIYKPQVTWYLSGLNRITGSVLSGGFYIFGAAYLAGPLFGWHLESSALAESFGALPTAAKVAIKFGVALPFTFHTWNGMRHLVWDTGRELKNSQIQWTGWAVVGATVVTSGALAMVGN